MKKIVIIGAGPCGIGAGWYLKNKNYPVFEIIEKNSYAGGLSASFRDKQGFVWDIGGHVLFSNKRIFNNFVNDVLGRRVNSHKRQAFIQIKGQSIPYPLQNHLGWLPDKDYELCLRGLKSRPRSLPRHLNFQQWLIKYFGEYLAKSFFIPLNTKMWGWPLADLSTQWIQDRVSPLNRKQSPKRSKAVKAQDHWGPNYRFLYPQAGGIGELFERACQKFSSRIKFGHALIQIDVNKKNLYFANGRQTPYDRLIYSGDIRDLVNMITPVNQKMIKASRTLKSNKILVFGIGLKKKRADSRSWIYFPERRYPFFRVTNLSNYSRHNVPGAKTGMYSSLLVEASIPASLGQAASISVSTVIAGLIRAGLMTKTDADTIVSMFKFTAERAYPIPTLERDKILKQIHDYLKPYHVFSRGRFGAFRYENGNMDDCFLQGYEAARLCMLT